MKEYCLEEVGSVTGSNRIGINHETKNEDDDDEEADTEEDGEEVGEVEAEEDGKEVVNEDDTDESDLSLEMYSNNRLEDLADAIDGGGSENIQYRKGNELKYSERPVLHTSAYTGVQINFMSSI